MLYLSIVLIVVGAVIFYIRRENMEKVDKKLVVPDFSPLWYSLDTFLPVVDLETSKYWIPNRMGRFEWWVVRIMIYLGWVIIPIALAAVTGILS